MRTASGARAVQIVYSQRRGSRDIEHIGSAHTDADLELLKAVARQRLAAGQGRGLVAVEPTALLAAFGVLGHRRSLQDRRHGQRGGASGR